MDSISLPYGTAHVKFSVITHLFAAAMCPPPDESGVRPGYDAVRSVVDRKLSRAVEVGDLSAKDPLTLAPHRYPVGDALREAVVGIDELRHYAARHGLPTINPVVPAASQSAGRSLERAV